METLTWIPHLYPDQKTESSCPSPPPPLLETAWKCFRTGTLFRVIPTSLQGRSWLWAPRSPFLDSLLSEEVVLEPTVLAPSRLLTVGHHCTALWQIGHPAHWLPLRKAVPAPPGIHALRGSCCGQWMKSHRVRTRCQRRKGACRSLKQGGEIMTFPRTPATLLWALKSPGTRGLDGQQASSAYANSPGRRVPASLGGSRSGAQSRASQGGLKHPGGGGCKQGCSSGAEISFGGTVAAWKRAGDSACI